MTVTSTVPGPGEVSCAYARDTPPMDNTAISTAVERIIEASLWPIGHWRIGRASPMPCGRTAKTRANILIRSDRRAWRAERVHARLRFFVHSVLYGFLWRVSMACLYGEAFRTSPPGMGSASSGGCVSASRVRVSAQWLFRDWMRVANAAQNP